MNDSDIVVNGAHTAAAAVVVEMRNHIRPTGDPQRILDAPRR